MYLQVIYKGDSARGKHGSKEDFIRINRAMHSDGFEYGLESEKVAGGCILVERIMEDGKISEVFMTLDEHVILRVLTESGAILKEYKK